ncbi:MAG TPA: adenylate/guanylate cyclase domain-containing protein [Gaiellaceae bacterium]|nr:adenylate/guanylate cyclase domain-containing protein [Gaiellaceae bacterium]
MRPETKYALSGDIHIAYQVVGTGPPDIVFVPEFWHSIEAQWDEPSFAAFLERVTSFGRLVSFDQRGTGLSDPVALSDLPSLEQWMDDVRAVMDEIGSEQAVLLGLGGGGCMAILFAATYPQRTAGLILVNSFARLSRAPDYPWGRSPDLEQDTRELMRNAWGRGVLLDQVAPSRVDDPEFRRWWARYQRLGLSPGGIMTVRSMLSEFDVRDVLPTVQAPTLVVHRRDNVWNRVEHGRYLGEHIPGAEYVEVPGADNFPFLGDSASILDRIERFVARLSEVEAVDRMLATLVFADVVGSTDKIAEVGDARWAQLLRAYHELCRAELDRFRGTEIDTAGDGIFASFDGPARAVRCAQAIVRGVENLGLGVRAGVHAGEVERRDGRVAGLAVHIAQRAMGEAERGTVVVTSTVKDLVAGSGLAFSDLGPRELKGVPERWHLYRVAE